LGFGFLVFGFPLPGGVACPLLKDETMLNPAIVEPAKSNISGDFWLRLLNDEELSTLDDLEKLVIGCEIIAALDTADLLAA